MIPACMGLASYGREPAVWPFAESHMGNSLPQSQRGLRTQPRVSTLGPSTQRRALKGRQIERAARCEIHLVASRQAPNWSLDVPIRGPKWPKSIAQGLPWVWGLDIWRRSVGESAQTQIPAGRMLGGKQIPRLGRSRFKIGVVGGTSL